MLKNPNIRTELELLATLQVDHKNKLMHKLLYKKAGQSKEKAGQQ